MCALLNLQADHLYKSFFENNQSNVTFAVWTAFGCCAPTGIAAERSAVNPSAKTYLPHGWLQPLLRNGTLKILHSNTPLTKLQYKFYWRSDDTRPLLAGLTEVALEMVDYDTPLLML